MFETPHEQWYYDGSEEVTNACMCSQQIQLIVFIEMLPEVTESKIFFYEFIEKVANS